MDREMDTTGVDESPAGVNNHVAERGYRYGSNGVIIVNFLLH